jgi:hypothetical protein
LIEAASCSSLRFPTCKEADTVRSGTIPRAGAQHLGISGMGDSRPLFPGVYAPSLAGWKKSLAHGDSLPFMWKPLVWIVSLLYKYKIAEGLAYGMMDEEEEKNGGSEGLGNACLVGAEKCGTRLSTNIFFDVLPPIGWLLVDVPHFGVETDISASLLACHERSEPVFFFGSTMLRHKYAWSLSPVFLNRLSSTRMAASISKI